MGGLSSRVELVGFNSTYRKFREAPRTVQTKAVETIQRESAPMVRAMDGATFTSIQRHAANALLVQKDHVGVAVLGAASGSSLDQALYYGGEYGGRKPKKVAYAARSPLGRAYFVRRRTTMQFLPHLGKHGYFMWPTVREWLPKINKSIDEAVREVLS
jgi:hypothetical protein